VLLKKLTPAYPDAQCLKDMLAVIRTLERSELDADYVKSQLEKWFNRHYTPGDSGLNHDIRRGVCYVDWLLNRSNLTRDEESACGES